MSKFRKKPVEVEAFQFVPVWGKVGVEAKGAPLWFLEALTNGVVEIWSDDEEPYVMIQTLEGRMRGNARDYIILGVVGEIYPCKPDVFSQTYETARRAG